MFSASPMWRLTFKKKEGGLCSFFKSELTFFHSVHILQNLEERELNIAQSHSASVPDGRKYEIVLMWSLLCTGKPLKINVAASFSPAYRAVVKM